MAHIIYTIGIPASGKTTWAKDFIKNNPTYFRVNRDSLRTMLYNSPWDKEKEQVVNSVSGMSVKAALLSGMNVVIDDTGISQTRYTELKKLVWGLGIPVTITPKFFPISEQDALMRNKLRPAEEIVPDDVIRDMYKKLGEVRPKWAIEEVFSGYSPVVQDESLPKAYVFDIDGTLAHNAHRGIFDATDETVLTDTVYKETAEILKSLSKVGFLIILLTGREETCGKGTLRWIEENDLPVHELITRRAGSNEHDFEYKRRVLENLLKEYYIIGAFEDRVRCVEMWRKSGIPCYQVNDGNF